MKFTKKKILLLSLLVIVLFCIFATKESKINDFPVPITAVHLEDNNPNTYTYYSLIRIDETKGWEFLGINGHTLEFQKGDRKVVVLNYPGEKKYKIFEE